MIKLQDLIQSYKDRMQSEDYYHFVITVGHVVDLNISKQQYTDFEAIEKKIREVADKYKLKGESMKKPRYIVFDGCDGLGKSTQLELLKKTLTGEGIPVYHTRALGGDGTCDFQQSIRKVLLHKKFPADAVDLLFEEKLFSICDNEGTKDAIRFLNQNPDGVVLKDRGVASHVGYSMARGMKSEHILQVHSKLLETEKEIHRLHGALHFVFVPTDVRFAMERIATRAKATGIEVVERLENVEFQRKVAANMSSMSLNPLARDFTIETISVSKENSIPAVEGKVTDVLRRYGY